MKKFGGVFLNQTFVDKNKVSDDDQEVIKKLHELKHYVFQFMELTDDTNRLKEYAKIVETIEYKLQKHWGFDIDRNYHDWFTVPKCICPKMDNMGYKGTPYKTITKSCKIHGDA